MPERRHLYQLIAANRLKTALFIALITLLLGIVGLALGWYFGWGIEAYALFAGFVIIYNLVLYYNSDRLALAVNRARPADPAEFRLLHNVVEEVAIAAGIPKPAVYVIDDPAPNAFATGRNPAHAAVAVTRGLLETMNREELQGVIAHEVAHIRNYDILLMTVVAIVGGLIVLFRDIFLRWGFFWGGRRDRRSSSRGGGQVGIVIGLVGLVLAILAPLFVALIRAAVSRQREYLADAAGALIVRNPNGLASALAKLGAFSGRLRSASSATAHLFIANPFGAGALSLFATHPPIEDRIRRLTALVVPDSDKQLD